MAVSSEEAPRKIPSRERTGAQTPIVFRGDHLLCASKDCPGLSSHEEASIAFCPASTHCDGSGSLSPRYNTCTTLHTNGQAHGNVRSSGSVFWADRRSLLR